MSSSARRAWCRVALVAVVAPMAAVCLSAESGAAVAGLADEPAWGIVIDPARRLCFADAEEAVVWCADALWRPAAVTKGVHAHDLLTASPDRLVGDDLRWDPAWRQWRRGSWELAGAGLRHELVPPTLPPAAEAGLLMNRAGDRFGVGLDAAVHAERLFRTAPDGHSVALAGGAPGVTDGRGPAVGFEGVRALRWGGDGKIYLTDGNAVRKVALDGTVSTLARIPDSAAGRAHLLGLAVTPHGVVVADFSGRRLLAIAGDGTVSVLGVSDPGWAPTGVVADGETLYTLEHRQAGVWGDLLGSLGARLRVERLSSGESTTVIDVEGSGGWGVALAALVGAGLIAAVSIGITHLVRPDSAPAPTAATPQVTWIAPTRSAGWAAPRSTWLTDHLFQIVAALVLIVTLLLFIRELLQPATDAARLGTLALILLIAGLACEAGPALISQIKKIGPIEFIEKSASLLEDVGEISDGLESKSAENIGRVSLSRYQLYVYHERDLGLTLFQRSGQKPGSRKQEQKYWLGLFNVGYLALLNGDVWKAISRLKQVQEESDGRYESASVAYCLGIAYIKAAQDADTERTDLRIKAAQCFNAAANEAVDHYQALFQLALVELDLGYFASAATNNRRSLAIRPQLGAAKYNLAIALLLSAQIQEGWSALESIVPGDSDFERIAKQARDDDDMVQFRADPRFETLDIAKANPLPF